MTETLFDMFLPTDRITLHQNMLLLENGRETVMIDAGAGQTPDFGGKIFGPTTGWIADNLGRVGLDPAQIDVILLTHLHPDHVWGLTGSDGAPVYENARIIVNEVDYGFWTDARRAEDPKFSKDALTFQGAIANLRPYRDRISFVADGEEALPGVVARAAAGHSPGQTMYDITSRGQRLLHWADVAHHPLLLARPELGIVFDFDARMAVETRRRVLDWVARERIEVFACHFGFPGRGHVRPLGQGFDWVGKPIEL
ncbi:MBL fold metallo-hydrolase [Pseudooceanicola sp.]|uniref:MBL fold metallo-hydrolase n=1 Tax=Pseudooceanicola sp. TaxID=1914328 RepID=UPI003517F7A4